MRPVIVCVDDEETVLTTIKKQLRFHFKDEFAIEVAESGEEALELLVDLIDSGTDIPVFISDQIMPGMKGDELLERVHSLLPDTLNILLTGQASVEELGKAVNRAQLYRYIGKPWEETDLALTVKQATHSYFQNKTLNEKHQELQKLNWELQQKVETFYKFVPLQFLEILNREQNFEQIELGLCAECSLSVLFSDIRSFTHLSEQMTTQEAFRFLNSYLAQMGPLIRKHSGFIDKYIGDSIMGLFEDTDHAVRAGIDILNHLYDYNAGRKRAGYIPISIGIGINSGELTLGTIGEHDRFETTVIGDVVNLASRIESFTKHYETPLLISGNTYYQLKNPGDYSIRFIDRVKVKGKDVMVNVFEVFDGDLPNVREGKIRSLATFDEAMDLFQHKSYPQAQVLFKECLQKNPGDNVSGVYVQRCKQALFMADMKFQDGWE